MSSATAIAAEIRAAIATGEYPYGARLPSVRDLAEQHGTSQQTISAAYAVLSAFGLVRTERGSGTTVSAGPAADAHLGTFSPPDLKAARAWQPSSGNASEETVSVRQLVVPDAMTSWGIDPGSTIVERTRIRSVDGLPVQHKITVMPYEIAASMPEGHTGVPPMLAPVGAPPAQPPHGVRMADWLGWDVSHTEGSITADPMDSAASSALRMPEGSPAFRIVNITRNSDGNVVYVTVTTAPLHHRVTLAITG